MILALVIYGWSLQQSVFNATRAWQADEREHVTIVREVAHVSSALGFGGFTNYFSNFVIRGDAADADIARTKLTLAGDSLKAAKSYMKTYPVGIDVAPIEDLLHEYRRRFEHVLRNRDRMSVTELDAMLLVDDGPAQAALSDLTLALEAREDAHYTQHTLQVQEIERRFAWGLLVLLAVVVSAFGLSFAVVRLDRLQHSLESTLDEVDTLLEEAPDTILHIDGAGRIVRANKQVTTLLGYAPAEIIGRSVDDLVPRDVRSRHSGHRRSYMMRPLSRDMASGRALAAMSKDGSLIPVTISLSNVYRSGDIMIIASLRDATADRAHEAALRYAREQAEELSELKSAFLANMSHEIRTPLTGMLAVGDLLAHSSLTPDQQRNVETLKQSGNHLLDILNDILDLSKLDAGLVEVQEDAVNLHTIADGVRSLYAVTAEAKGIDFSVDFAGSAIESAIIGDAVRLKQILFNLTGNAVKFTQKGRVKVTFELATAPTSESKIFIARVQDTGVGMSEEDVQSIFDPFVQVDRRRSRSTHGTGLGLSICKRLAETMGGRITVESQPGVGSTFVFSLPVRLSANRPAQDRPSNVVLFQPLRDMHILAVDDNALNRTLVVEILGSRGIHSVDTACDGEDALQKILSNDYDAVLLDVRMPKLDGPEVLTRLRELAPEKAQNIIAFTADATVDRIREYQALGFAGYVSKPINWQQLAEALHKVSEGEMAADRAATAL